MLLFIILNTNNINPSALVLSSAAALANNLPLLL